MSLALEEQLSKMLANNRKNAHVLSGIVSSVDEKEGTLVLQREGYTDIIGVRIDAVKIGSSRVSVIPKIGSAVIATQIDETEEYVMMKTSEVEKVQWKVDDFELSVNEKGRLNIKKGSDDFLSQLTKLVDVVRKIVVVQGKGPDLTALTEIETKLKNIFFS